MDSRVQKAIERLRAVQLAERLKIAAGPIEVQAVLLLARPPLTVEANYVASVAHLQGQGPFLALQGVAEERGREANDRLDEALRRRGGPSESTCGRLCVLENQGPCRCVVPPAVAELRRRQRALLWAAEALMRPSP